MMGRLLPLVAAVCPMVFVASCSRPATPRATQPKGARCATQAAQLRSANVEDDVRAAVAKGDYRFLCVTGEGVYAPGLADLEFTAGIGVDKVDMTRFRIIDETYDDIGPEAAAAILEFKSVAETYARQYNTLLKRSVATKPPVTSGPEERVKQFWEYVAAGDVRGAASCVNPAKVGSGRHAVRIADFVQRSANVDVQDFRYETYDTRVGVRSARYSIDFDLEPGQDGQWVIVSIHP
jgi:hypothetical protein